MEKEIKEQEQTPATEEQQVINAVEHVDPNIVLRNLAFWLDIAIAKGRYVDMLIRQQEEQKLDPNGVSSPDNDKE